MAFLSSGASGVKLADPLKKPLQGINQQSQKSLQDVLGRVSGRETASANASGRVQGPYIPETLNTAGVSAGHGVENALAGVLGQGSYQDYNNEQDFQRNMALTKEIADLNSPSTLQEILGGLGAAGQAAGQFAPLYGALKQQPRTKSLPPSLSLFDPYKSGYSRYA